MKCRFCGKKASIILKRHKIALCTACYPEFFRKQVEKSIDHEKMFKKDDMVCVAVSGGKDSMALLHTLKKLGYSIEALYIDLGIKGYSKKCREIVTSFCETNDINCTVYDLKKERGKTLGEVLSATRRPACSICGAVKRQVMNMVARKQGYDAVATGHNLDDELVFLFSNLLKSDVSALVKQRPVLHADKLMAKKVKPLYRLTDLEVKYYVEVESIPHQVGECPYSPGARTLLYKQWWNMLEDKSPGIKANFYFGFLRNIQPNLISPEDDKNSRPNPCRLCGEPTNREVCSVCALFRK